MTEREYFEEWFASVELGDGDFSIPTIKDGARYFDYIARRGAALAAWKERGDFERTNTEKASLDPQKVPPIEKRVLCVQMIASELVELARAMGVELRAYSLLTAKPDNCVNARDQLPDFYDPIKAADALGEIRHLVDGGNLICGFPGGVVLAEIHHSNMSKPCDDWKPILRADGTWP